MSAFEEQFPSLKDKQYCHAHHCSDAHCTSWDKKVPTGGHLLKEDVKKYCLDKQKVKEAIDKHLQKYIDVMNGFPETKADDMIFDLKKELRLDEE